MFSFDQATTEFIFRRQQVQMLTNKLYKVLWCHPIADVKVVDVASGIYFNTTTTTTTTTNINNINRLTRTMLSGQYDSKYIDDLLHDLATIGDIISKVYFQKCSSFSGTFRSNTLVKLLLSLL